MNSRLYLVTGIAGFIGSKLGNFLIRQGHTIYGIDNFKTGFRENIPKGCLFIEGDFSKDSTIKKLNNVKFDAIFHIGGQSSGEISFENPEYDLNTNTLSTLKLLKYSVETGCKKFIYASSMSVYGEQDGKEKFSEDDRTFPKSFYAVGKLASENYLKIYSSQFGIEYTIFRYFNVYGPGQNLDNLKQGMISIYLKQFIDDNFKEVVVKGSVERFRDFIFIDDVVNITIEALFNPEMKNEIFNVGTGKKIYVKDVLYFFKKILKSSKDIKIEKGTPGDQFGIYADISKLKTIYKSEFTSIEEGLKKMIEWVKGEINAQM